MLSGFVASNPEASGPKLQYDWLVGIQYKLMELAKGEWALIRKSPVWLINFWIPRLKKWVYGKTLDYILSGLKPTPMRITKIVHPAFAGHTAKESMGFSHDRKEKLVLFN